MTPHTARTFVEDATVKRRTTLIASTLHPVVTLAAVLSREVRFRRDQYALSTMDDHLLSDIGIGRSQIDSAVRNGRISSWTEKV